MKPDIRYTDRNFQDFLPSWSNYRNFINENHTSIYEKTRHLEGWQAIADSRKLFEMAYFCGEVILEIGVYGGRSAAVELLGALDNPARKNPPQYFGIDHCPRAIARSLKNLTNMNLDQYAMLFLGDIDGFARHFSISPTMVFVDGDHRYRGLTKDLEVLSGFLAPETPVFCHDYMNPENRTGEMGVRKACDDWEASGYADFIGTFGAGALFLTTSKCETVRGALIRERFSECRERFNRTYELITTMIDQAASEEDAAERLAKLVPLTPQP
jgi:hypothetical protein